MNNIIRKYDLIETHELNFAKALASKLIPNPELSAWMILIPIIFIYFFYQKNRYATGCEKFVQHYMIARKRALDAALKSATNGESPDLSSIVKMAGLPEDTHDVYHKFIEVLTNHYLDLFKNDGDSFGAIIQSTYRTKTRFLLFCNQLNQVEKDLNAVLKPHLTVTPGHIETMEKIEQLSEEMTRKNVELFFG